MEKNDYALVAYLPGRLGAFVDKLRHRFNPALAAWLPHVTILPPRTLAASQEEMLPLMRDRCAVVAPFDATVHGAATFWPVSGVVYLSFSSGSQHLRQLHDDLNTGSLQQREVHPYVPHITIAQELDEEHTQAVLADVKREWSMHDFNKSFRIELLSLVQYTLENKWRTVTEVSLGDRMALSKR